MCSTFLPYPEFNKKTRDSTKSTHKTYLFLFVCFQSEFNESKEVVGDDDENDIFPDNVGDQLGIQVKSERNNFVVTNI